MALAAPAGGAVPPGTFDSSFGNGGVSSQSLGQGLGAYSYAQQVALQSDGKIVVAGGATGAGGYQQLMVARLNPNGTLDGSFGTNGSTIVQFGQGSHHDSSATSLVVQPDGKIVVVGQANGVGGDEEFLVARFNADGTLDASFGTAGSGYVLTQLGQGGFPDSIAWGVALQSDGKIVVAGRASGSTGNDELLVARLDGLGDFDPSFGTGGVSTQQVGLGSSAFASGQALALQADGKIVVSGQASDTGGAAAVMLARLNSSGMLDSSFGNGGAVVKQFSAGGSPDSRGEAVVVQPDGKIVTSGFANDNSGNEQLLVARVNGDGSFDSSFAGGGTLIKQLGGGATPWSEGDGLVLQPEGKLVVSGDATGANGDFQLMVARINGNGTIDTPFGSGGAVVSQVGNGTPSFSNAPGVVLEADQKIVAAGTASVKGQNQLAVVRLLGDPPPTAAFRSSPSPAHPGRPITLDASVSSDPYDPITTYSWNLGDGSSAMGIKPSHTYRAPGTYRVTLTITAADGLSGSIQRSLTILPAPPAISRARQSRRVWREGKKLARISRRRPAVGTVFSFSLDEKDRVRFSFNQRVGGRKVNGKCVARTKRNAHKRACKRTVAVATLRFNGHAGRNKISFQGRMSRKRRLKPGRYRLVMVATDNLGQRSNPARLTFTIAG